MIFPPVFSLNLYRYMYNSTIYWWTDCPISFIVYLLYIIQMEKYDLSIMMLYFFSFYIIQKKEFFILKVSENDLVQQLSSCCSLKQRCYIVGGIYEEVST